MGKYLTQMETKFISDSIEQTHPGMVMDIGAEAGKFSLLASEKKANVVSVDMDSVGLKRIKLQNNNIHVIKGDARRIPLRSGVFDAVFMIEVLDYIPEGDKVFKECYRTLKLDGLLVFSFGNKSSFKQKLRKLRGKSYLHSYRRVMQGLSKAGFIVKRKLGFNWGLFGRTSESRLIPLWIGLERVLGLRKIPSLSPWVLINSVKPNLSISAKP